MPHDFSHHLGKPRASQHQSEQSVVDVSVTSAGRPLAGALVFLVVQNFDTGTQHVHAGMADPVGEASLTFAPAEEKPLYVSAVAQSGTWYGASQKFGGRIAIECPPLVFDGPLGWWHKSVGITKYDPKRGQGVSVGLVDTGTGPHPYLSHVADLGAMINGQHTADGEDVSYHGTMMAGLIGARPDNSNHPAGIAPGAALSSVRVYEGGAHGAKADDVAQAIRHLATNVGVDLINLSLSSEKTSDAQAAAIEEARAAGTYCIAAAGNTGAAPVGYPAALENVAAVGAMGRDACGPTAETNLVFAPKDPAKCGENGLYLSAIGSYGPGLTCLAPGTAIASTVASRDGAPLYAAQVGSSDAVAIVTGLLAARLSTDPAYLMLDRTAARSDYAARTLRQLCQSLGLPSQYQGCGKPSLTS